MDPLWALLIILIVLGAIGYGAAYTLGGLLHLLLIVALVVLVIRLLQGRSL